MTVREFCERHHACDSGRAWALATGEPDMATLWARTDLKLDWRIWIATRPFVLRDRELRQFACWCVRQVWYMLVDERSLNAVEVAERFAVGNATAGELIDASAAAALVNGGRIADAAWYTAHFSAATAAFGAAWGALDARLVMDNTAFRDAHFKAAEVAQSEYLLKLTRPQFT